MTSLELNLDGLVGPTHNYAGLSPGNLASARNRRSLSNPRAAALQGLEKMRLLASMGVPQVVLPPHDRPDLSLLRSLGFEGSDAQVLARARAESPALLAASASAASMWAANAATVSASADTADGRVHFTPANLATNLHRAIEAKTTTRVLRAIFPDARRFVVHDPLPPALGDEGAANHTRLARSHGEPGVEFFVYGRGGPDAHGRPTKFPARQSFEASAAIARRHGLDPRRVVFAQQRPDAIDAGVFHNDVIAVGHLGLLFCHERAWVDQPAVLRALRAACRRCAGGTLKVVEVTSRQVPIADAVRTYLFNSQIVTPAGDEAGQGSRARPTLVCPSEALERPTTRRTLDRLVSGPGRVFESLVGVDVRQSMRNGGGPACLRLRVPLRGREIDAVLPSAIWSPALHEALTSWIERHYRESLVPDDLADPALLREGRDALDELTRLLKIGTVYEFQM